MRLLHAELREDFGVNSGDDTSMIVSVARGTGWPFLLVGQRFAPGPEAGFFPGALLIPETHIFLLGAGTRLLAYDLRKPERIWEDEAAVGFWGWSRHEDVVLMSAELELAAWDLHARKQRTTCVEPPWSYEVRAGRMYLDVMGELSDFPIDTGPSVRDPG